MQFVYKPSGTPEAKWKRWDFAPAKMSNRDAEALEDLTDWTFLEWQQKLFAGSVRAVHAYLYLLLRKDDAKLKYDDVEFTDEEYDLEPSEAEEKALADADAGDQAETLDVEVDPKDE